MVYAEQLTLNFSVPDFESGTIHDSSSNVLSLDRARHARLERDIQNVYREISDSVKHVKLRLKTDRDEGSNSSFG